MLKGCEGWEEARIERRGGRRERKRDSEPVEG